MVVLLLFLVDNIKNNSYILGKFIFIIGIVIIFYAISNSIIVKFRLKQSGVCTMGEIFDRESPGGKSKPGLIYRFNYKGGIYNGIVAEDDILKVGDSICIVYLKSSPSTNRPLRFFDSGDMKCSNFILR